MAESARLGGDSPLGHLSDQQVELLALRALVAMLDAACCLHMSRDYNPHSAYWAADGSGGAALAEADAVVASLGFADIETFDRDTYRSYFRTARPLLFPGIGRYKNRMHCAVCGAWVESGIGSGVRAFHARSACSGTWQGMTIADIHYKLRVEGE